MYHISLAVFPFTHGEKKNGVESSICVCSTSLESVISYMSAGLSMYLHSCPYHDSLLLGNRPLEPPVGTIV